MNALGERGERTASTAVLSKALERIDVGVGELVEELGYRGLSCVRSRDTRERRRSIREHLAYESRSNAVVERGAALRSEGAGAEELAKAVEHHEADVDDASRARAELSA